MEFIRGNNIDNFCDNPMKQLKQIWRSRMSPSYVNEDLLREGLSGRFLYACVEEGEILGYAVGETIKVSNFISEFDDEKVKDVVLKHVSSKKSNIGVLRTIAVSEENEGRGIASKVSREVSNDLNKCTEATFSEAWRKRGKVDGSVILEKIGFN